MVRHHTYTDTRQPPRRATPATPPQEGNGPAPYLYQIRRNHPVGLSPATPPQEGNGPAPYLYRHETTTPSGFARHPSTGEEWSGTILIQTRDNHPVGLRPPPLHRRGMVRHHTYTDTTQPPRRASPATPPQEGNGPAPYLYRHETNTPSGFARHPSTGGEWSGTILIQTRDNHPVGLRPPPLHRRGMVRHHTYTDTRQPPRRASPATPPQERNGPAPYLYRHETTTPSGFARHPSTGEEWSGTILIQTRHNHPVGLRPPPLHRRGMVRHHTYTDTTQTPRRASPATPPQEGNGSGTILIQTRHNHPVKRSLTPLHRRGISLL